MTDNLLLFRRIEQEAIILSSLFFSNNLGLEDEEYYVLLNDSKMKVIESLGLYEIPSFQEEIEDLKSDISVRILSPLSTVLIADQKRKSALVIQLAWRRYHKRRLESARHIQQTWREVNVYTYYSVSI